MLFIINVNNNKIKTCDIVEVFGKYYASLVFTDEQHNYPYRVKYYA